VEVAQGIATSLPVVTINLEGWSLVDAPREQGHQDMHCEGGEYELLVHQTSGGFLTTQSGVLAKMFGLDKFSSFQNNPQLDIEMCRYITSQRYC